MSEMPASGGAAEQEKTLPVGLLGRLRNLRPAIAPILVATALLGSEPGAVGKTLTETAIDSQDKASNRQNAQVPMISLSSAGMSLEAIANASDTGETGTQGFDIIAIAHADDEGQGWAGVQNSEFPVFVLGTHGEESAYCETPELDGRGSQACREARLSSFEGFLNEHYPAELVETTPAYQLYIGEDVEEESARFIFDFGDKDLSPAEVFGAIALAEDIITERTGRELRSVIGAGYYNTFPPDRIYDHPDHLAVHQGVRQYGREHNIDTSVRVAASNPDANSTLSVENPDEVYACNPDSPENLGTGNIYYGWLMGEAQNGCFYTPEEYTEQSFIYTPADAQ